MCSKGRDNILGSLFRRLFGGKPQQESASSEDSNVTEPTPQEVPQAEAPEAPSHQDSQSPVTEVEVVSADNIPSFRPGQKAPTAGCYVVVREGKETDFRRDMVEGGRFPPPPKKGDVYRLALD